MSDLTNEELIATRRLHGLNDGLFEEEKNQEKMNIENDEIEYEKMIIDIPKKTRAVLVVSIAEVGCQLVMNTHTYDTEDVKERKIEGEGKCM
jgi:hypothetical protein|nr:MAG TPA: hypothetical protein [Caudoviricetes sp.]